MYVISVYECRNKVNSNISPLIFVFSILSNNATELRNLLQIKAGDG